MFTQGILLIIVCSKYEVTLSLIFLIWYKDLWKLTGPGPKKQKWGQIQEFLLLVFEDFQVITLIQAQIIWSQITLRVCVCVYLLRVVLHL